jgi:hypothetical protein
MVTANLAKAGWALVALESLEYGARAIKMRRVALQFVRALPYLLFTQLTSLFRFPLSSGTCLWPVVCIFEKRKGFDAVRRSMFLTRHARAPLRALLIREIGISVFGAAYGVVITPVLATSSYADAGFKVFQSFCTFIMSVPWAMSTLAAYTIAYFESRQIMGEGSDLGIFGFQGSRITNRIPAVSGQSKAWLAATAATILVIGYIYSQNEIFNTARSGEHLIKAGEQGRIARMKQLLAAGTNVETVIGGWSPLTRSVLFGQVQAVELLLAAGADVNRQDRHVGSALYLAVATRNLDIAKKLLDHGADPNTVPEWGETPLMVAAMQGNDVGARLLLERGADPARRSKEGTLASALAREEGHLELAELIARAEKP